MKGGEIVKRYYPLSYAPLDDGYLFEEDAARIREHRAPRYDDEEIDEEMCNDGPDPLRLMKKARTGATVQAM